MNYLRTIKIYVMKKLVFVLLLLTSFYRLKAQESMQMTPSDSLTKSMLNKPLPIKPGNNFSLFNAKPLDSRLNNLTIKQMPNPNMELLAPMHGENQLFVAVTKPQNNITISPVDHMPIVHAGENSKMPVAKFRGNDKMTVTPLKVDSIKLTPLP